MPCMVVVLCCYVQYCDGAAYNDDCSSEACTDNGQECDGTTSTCKCKTGYFENGAQDGCIGTAGYGCQLTSECSTGAVCIGSVCVCTSDYYDSNGATIGGTCQPKKSLGANCPGNLGPAASCIVSYAECRLFGSSTTTFTCQCKSTHYDNNGGYDGGTCKIKKGLLSSCTSYLPPIYDQCSDPNALCTNGNPGACTCNPGYHSEGSTCEPNKALGDPCDPNVSGECSDSYAQCLSNPTAQLCTCGTGYYKFNNNGVDNCELVSQLQVTNIQFSSVTTSKFTVSWSPPAGKSGYVSRCTVTWRPTDNSGSDSSISIDSPTSFTTVTAGLTSGQAYKVTITSINFDTQQGSDRSTSTYKEQAIKPSQPGPLILSESNLDAGSNDISIKWTASTGKVSIYSVEILDGSTSLRTASIAAAQTTISSTALKHGYTYTINIITRSKQYGTNNAVESSTTYTTTIKTVVKAPELPSNAQCIESTDATIKLKWDATSSPNGVLKEYLITIYEGSNTDLTFTRELLTGNFNTEFIVENLDSGAYYRFEVFTVNEQFYSATGVYTPAPHCATRAQSFTVPQNFEIDNIVSRGLTTSWTRPANINTGELFGYVLQIKDGDSCVSEQMYKCSGCIGTNIDILFQNIEQQCGQTVQTTTLKTKAELSGQQTFTTNKLLPYINYTVIVAAVNSEGKGYADEKYVHTHEEAPITPTSVVTPDITSTTVLVRWSIDGPRPGVTTYTVMVEPVDTAAPIVTRTVQGFTNTSYMVTGLEEFWTYTVKVKVETSIGEKTSDASLEFKTLAAAPGPVDAFAIETPGGDYTNLKISWKTPTVLQRNGVIKSFNFTHNATELTSSIELGSPETFDAKSLAEYVYEKTVVVQPENIYKFEVYAVNEDDQQGYVTSEIKMAPAGVPQTPMNVDISDIRSTSVVVTWNIEGPRPGITTYTVMVVPENTAASAVTQQVYGFDNTSCTVIGLEEFWEYTARVKVETPVGGATSDVTPIFKTLSAPPGPVDAFTIKGPFNGDFTQMQISWKIPTLLHRNGVIKALKIVHNATRTSTIESEETSKFPARQEDFIYSIIVDVIPTRTYSFQVYAINTEDMTGEITKETIVAPSPETQSSSNIAVIIAAVLGGVVLLLIVALVIFIVRYKRLKVKRNGRQNSKPQAKTEEKARFDNIQEVSIPVSGDYANNYMELDDTSRVNTYDKIAIGRPEVESSATDTGQYETPDVPSQNRWK